MQVPFHGRLIRGWVLGPTNDVPVRTASVKKAVTPVRAFDASILELLRWVSNRYVAPLATVISRSHPPRVASEESSDGSLRNVWERPDSGLSLLGRYRHGTDLFDALRAGGSGGFVIRPAPEDEVAIAVESVGTCLSSGRTAVVLVPEAKPIPATAVAIAETFGERVALFLGGNSRARYRIWLDVGRGRYDVVVGTRSAVFAPVSELGLMYVSRESHDAHREDRAPYYHVREVALARTQMAGGACVLSALCPSVEAAALDVPKLAPSTRRWPPVEVVRPGPEGRAPRLLRALREARRAFLFSPLPGYGMAQVCKTCLAPAACAACGGSLRSEAGSIRCSVCEAPGRCANCGGSAFGIRRGGAERVREWAASVASVRVTQLGAGARPRLPRDGEVVVGGPEAVRDLGPGGLDLVGVLDADLADRLPGLSARQRVVATWMEAVGWARPNGRAIVQSNRANDPAVQALVRGNPDRFHIDEAARRASAGFPVGSPVFRIGGSDALAAELAKLDPITLLTSSFEGQTVCLAALEPHRLAEFGGAMRDLAGRNVVGRVEAEPHL